MVPVNSRNTPLLASMLIFFIMVILLPQSLLAAFSLSVTPFEGGYDLQFGKVTPALGRVNKEVTVRITSDSDKQYRITQVLLDPLSAQQGNAFPPNSFFVYGIRGTNAYGTLNVEQEIPVSFARQILYTSNAQGSSDSFTLVYSLAAPVDMVPGYYRGRLGFTLEPIGIDQSPVTVILNISCDVEVESSIQITTATGSKQIVLKAASSSNNSAEVIFKMMGSFGRPFTITQIVDQQPVSSEGDLLDWSAIHVVGQGAQKGLVVNQPLPLGAAPQLLYTSSPGGDADTFAITYYVKDTVSQKAGRYTAAIKYILESQPYGQSRLVDMLGLEIENPRIFDLVVTPEGTGLIQFRELKPRQPPKTQEVVLEIMTNIAKPYQVTQNMASGLTNPEGRVIPSNYFLLREEKLDTKGALRYPDSTEVKEGQMVLFVSDKNGSPDKFKVIYELTVPRDLQPGDYSTVFTYSVSEI